MDKILLRTKEQFDDFLKSNTGYQPGYGNVTGYMIEEGPTKYPCVLVWSTLYDSNGPDYIMGEFVYLEDFEI